MIADVKVKANKRIGKGLYRLALAAPKGFKAEPGQFVNVLVSETYEPLLRRPFSIFDFTPKGIEIVYKVIGKGTELLSQKKAGEKLNIIGPLGNGYPISGLATKKLSTVNRQPSTVLIGGGTGAASVYFLAKTLKAKRIPFTLIQGARKKELLLAVKEYKSMKALFASEDGSIGKKGFVTDILKNVLNDNAVIFTCGPKPMFRAIQDTARAKKNVKIYASFEEYMGCGIGACLSCVIPVKKGEDFEYKRVCKEGTVFNLSEVIL